MTSKEQTLKMLRNEVCSTCSFYRFKAYSSTPSDKDFDWCWKKQDVPDPPTCEVWEKVDENPSSYNPNAGAMTISIGTAVEGNWNISIDPGLIKKLAK